MHPTADPAADIPPIHRSPSARADSGGWPRRIVAVIVAIAAGSVLGLAAWLTPAAEGHGTHQQLRLPPCSWVVLADMPCPTCGMTTSFAHAADGNLIQSFLTQPLGSILAMATAMALITSIYVLITGAAIEQILRKLWSGRMTWILIALVLLSWGYKILQFKADW